MSNADVLAEHARYLRDATRINAFRRAITEVVPPGATVLDLGSGTGVLGILAARAGAAHVFAIDGSSAAALTEAVLGANQMTDRVTVIQNWSRQVTLPEPADVVVADQLDGFGAFAGLFSAFADARQRNLKQTAHAIPSSVTFWTTPVESEASYEAVDAWTDGLAGLSVTAVRELAANTRWSLRRPAAFDVFDVSRSAPLDPLATAGTVRWSGELTAGRSATIHGLAAGFIAQLSPSVMISNIPGADDAIDRDPSFLPFLEPVVVRRGDVWRVEIVLVPDSQVLRWSLRHGDVIRSQSLFRGELLSSRDLALLRPEHRPVIGRRGQAAARLLELLDGTRTTQEACDLVWAQDASPYATKAELMQLAHDLVRRYC